MNQGELIADVSNFGWKFEEREGLSDGMSSALRSNADGAPLFYGDVLSSMVV